MPSSSLAMQARWGSGCRRTVNHICCTALSWPAPVLLQGMLSGNAGPSSAEPLMPMRLQRSRRRAARRAWTPPSTATRSWASTSCRYAAQTALVFSRCGSVVRARHQVHQSRTIGGHASSSCALPQPLHRLNRTIDTTQQELAYITFVTKPRAFCSTGGGRVAEPVRCGGQAGSAAAGRRGVCVADVVAERHPGQAVGGHWPCGGLAPAVLAAPEPARRPQAQLAAACEQITFRYQECTLYCLFNMYTQGSMLTCQLDSSGNSP